MSYLYPIVLVVLAACAFAHEMESTRKWFPSIHAAFLVICWGALAYGSLVKMIGDL